MKKLWHKIRKFLINIFTIFLLILLGICFVFMLPYDYIKYKRSLYYKKEHKKYKIFAASGVQFDVYNEILKNELPIKYVPNPEIESLEYGWFVFENTLIIPNVFSFEFDEQSQKWNYYNEDDEEKRVIMPLDEYIEGEIQDANELAGQVICNNAIVLIDGNCIGNKDIARNEKRFLIYEENREEILKQLCETPYSQKNKFSSNVHQATW